MMPMVCFCCDNASPVDRPACSLPAPGAPVRPMDTSLSGVWEQFFEEFGPAGRVVLNRAELARARARKSPERRSAIEVCVSRFKLVSVKQGKTMAKHYCGSGLAVFHCGNKVIVKALRIGYQ